MHSTPIFAARGPTVNATDYLVRFWTPESLEHGPRPTSDWWLEDVESVVEAIDWARGQAASGRVEVMLVAEDGTLMRVWADESKDARREPETGQS